MATSTLVSRCFRSCRTLSPYLYRNTRYLRHREIFNASIMPVVQKCEISHHSFPFPDKIPTEEAARRMVVSLDDNARRVLSQELEKFEHERTDLDAKSSVSSTVLWAVFLFNGIPFIAFGILDNFIMIVAGEYIDVTLGTMLGISTMAAAGLGNLVSDVAGVGTTGYVERLVSKLGIKSPSITPREASMRQTRWTVSLGRSMGIALGCLIGMFPLLFFSEKDDEEKHLESSASETEETTAATAKTTATTATAQTTPTQGQEGGKKT